MAEALRILRAVDDRYGRLDFIEASGLTPGFERRQMATRFCAAFCQLILDPQTPFDAATFERLSQQHRWLELMFSASGFGSSDHMVTLLSITEGGAKRIPAQNLARFLLLFSAAAGMDLDLEAAFQAAQAPTVAAALGYLSSRFVFTATGHAFRERLLAWLPSRLADVKLGEMALQAIASPYMHCSYAVSPTRHDVKAVMIAQMRRALLENGCPEWDGAPPAAAPRPSIVVTTENFSDGHSVHRTHSLAVQALRERFHVTGLLHAAQVSPAVEACFDEVLRYEGDSLYGVVGGAARQILERRPAMVLHLGVGMSAFVIGLASLRLAPVQAASFGHTATTRSPEIDAMILPEDFVGDPSLFSERLVRLPPAAMPYRLRAEIDFAAIRRRAEHLRGGDAVRIAVPASVMKLGPPLFEALAQVAAAARRPVAFHIFPLGCAGLGHEELVRRLAAALPTAIAHEELPYEAYIERLAACDFFVCPFPYGNMNSIVDAVMVGLPGVCLDGPEAHAHADVGYFRRLGLPGELATSSLEAYVTAIVRLVDDPAWLAECRACAQEVGRDHPFFEGAPELFTRAIEALIADPRPRGAVEAPGAAG